MTSEIYPHTGTVTLNGLVQNTRVHYAVSVDGKQVRALGSPGIPNNARDATATE